MTFRTTVLFAWTLLFAATMAHSPAMAASLGDPASLNARAPDSYKATFETSKGTVVVQVPRDWAPNGAERCSHLV